MIDKEDNDFQQQDKDNETNKEDNDFQQQDRPMIPNSKTGQ